MLVFIWFFLWGLHAVVAQHTRRQAALCRNCTITNLQKQQINLVQSSYVSAPCICRSAWFYSNVWYVQYNTCLSRHDFFLQQTANNPWAFRTVPKRASRRSIQCFLAYPPFQSFNKINPLIVEPSRYERPSRNEKSKKTNVIALQRWLQGVR